MELMRLFPDSFPAFARTAAAAERWTRGAVAEVSLTPPTPEGFPQTPPLRSTGCQVGSLRKAPQVTGDIDEMPGLALKKLTVNSPTDLTFPAKSPF